VFPFHENEVPTRKSADGAGSERKEGEPAIPASSSVAGDDSYDFMGAIREKVNHDAGRPNIVADGVTIG